MTSSIVDSVTTTMARVRTLPSEQPVGADIVKSDMAKGYPGKDSPPRRYSSQNTMTKPNTSTAASSATQSPSRFSTSARMMSP